MAFEVSSGKQRNVRPSMNVTPLVDVVLVLLIIFMVVTPLLTKQLWLNVPPKADENAAPPPANAVPPIVLTYDKAGVIKVNNEIIERREVPKQLISMLNARADKVVFFDAESSVPYGQAIEVLDELRGGGVTTIAVLADEMVPAGQ